MDKRPAEQLRDIRRRYSEGSIQPSDDMEFLLDLVDKLQQAVMNLAIDIEQNNRHQRARLDAIAGWDRGLR